MSRFNELADECRALLKEHGDGIGAAGYRQLTTLLKKLEVFEASAAKDHAWSLEWLISIKQQLADRDKKLADHG